MTYRAFRRWPSCVVGLALLALVSTPTKVGWAQDAPAGGEGAAVAPETAPAAPAEGPPTIIPYAPPIIRTQTTPAEPFDPNSHLPSGSKARSDISEGDSFDFDRSDGRSKVMRGASDAPGVFEAEVRRTSGMYLVQPGDTLSGISQEAFGQPWMWPKLWSLNPQIQNPHWIYPGDQVRLSAQGDALAAVGDPRTLGADGPLRQQLIPPNSVFLRQLGYLDDPRDGIMGEVVGAVEPVQLMSQSQHVYIVLKRGQTVSVGQQLRVFREVRSPPKVRGARRPPGKIVAIQGTVVAEYVNPKTRIVRALVVEATQEIERGAKVGVVEHEYRIVPPQKVDSDVTARVLTSMYPHEIMGQQQVVFIDRGAKDGLVAGNRLFVVRRGDTWRRTLPTTTAMARTRINMESADHLDLEAVPLHGNEREFPEEVIAELRIFKAHDFASLALVTASKQEIVPGDRAIARAGF